MMMRMKEHTNVKVCTLLLILIVCILCIITPCSSFATTSDEVGFSGKVYFFEKDNTYQYSSLSQYYDSSTTETYGKISFESTSAPLVPMASNVSGVPSYSVADGHIVIKYIYDDSMLSKAAEEWHLVDDNNTTIDVFKVTSNIRKGAVIVQKSMDHLNWYNISTQTNAFVDTPVQNGVLYETSDIEMINGCYYRVIVVYELAMKTGTSTVALVIPQDVIEYKRVAEVYEFYAVNSSEHIEPLTPTTKKFSLGKSELVADFASYSGTKDMGKDDLHYGWELGNFFVSGFTSQTTTNGQTVFLKNVGDVVTLWFNLKQNISALKNDASLTITSDSDGYDQGFQTPMTNFGKGMLIIRYTDHENVQHEPVMYYDYLLANTSMGADTRVQLFEEGDYEVALDYEVTKSQLIPQTHHYRIFFKFSVRNANCMAYPFDVTTGAELMNSSVTENGFYLDLAKSRYLDIYIKKEVWTEGAEGLVEDTRFNTSAKDGDRYTDEGIYTITVRNKYTGQETKKKIYVGTNRILLAYMNSNYSIAEIQRLVEQGAVIYEDGTIELPELDMIPDPTEEPNSDEKLALNPTEKPEVTHSSPVITKSPNQNEETSEDASSQSNSLYVVILIVSVGIALLISVIIYYKKHPKVHDSGTNDVCPQQTVVCLKSDDDSQTEVDEIKENQQ